MSCQRLRPDFFTEIEGVITWLPTMIEMSERFLAWLGVEMTINSVLVSFNFNLFAVIHCLMSTMQLLMRVMAGMGSAISTLVYILSSA